jgi:acyl dehydratase
MTFIQAPGIRGQLYLPEEPSQGTRKHNCEDCAACMVCNDDKCAMCLKQKNAAIGMRLNSLKTPKDYDVKLRYFEDIELNVKEKLGEYCIDKEEVIEFGKKWDPQPFHVDEDAARDYPYGGIIAPNAYTMAIITMLAANSELKMATIGLLGYDELRFPNPARPGDVLTMISECIDKRVSRSNSNHGIVQTNVEMANQKGEPVLTSRSMILNVTYYSCREEESERCS